MISLDVFVSYDGMHTHDFENPPVDQPDGYMDDTLLGYTPSILPTVIAAIVILLLLKISWHPWGSM